MTKSTKRFYALATAILFYSALNSSIKPKNITYEVEPGYRLEGTTAVRTERFTYLVDHGYEPEGTTTKKISEKTGSGETTKDATIKYDTTLDEDNRVLSDEHYLLEDNQFSYIPEENKQLKRKR